MTNLKLPKEVYPGFSTTKTPTCPVVIDWANPLSRGIKFACLFSQGFNNLRTGAGAITNQFTREADRVRQTSTNILQYDRGDTGFNSELGTFALDMKGYSGNDFYARILEISGTEYQLLRQTDSEVGFNIGGSVVYFSGFDTIFGAGADTNIVARWDEANSSRKVTVNDKTVSDATSFTVTNTSTDVYIFNRADGGRPSDAALSYLVIWDRFLSQKETDEFNAAPYQIFKPAIDISYYFPAQEEVTSTRLVRLPKEFYPGFSTKVKPTVPVVLDMSHPDASKAVHYYYAQGNVPVTLGKNPVAGGNQPTGTIEVGPFGQGISNTTEISGLWNSIDGYPFTMYGRWFTQTGITTGSPNIIMVWGRVGGGVSTRARIRCNITDVSSDINWGGTALTAISVSHNSTLDEANSAVVDVFIECVSSTEKTLYLYLNGELIGSDTVSTDTTSTDSTAFGEWQRLTFSQATTGSVLQQVTFDGLIDKDSYARNPYQLLKPAIDITYFVPSAGAAPPAVTEIPPQLHMLDSQFATINAHRLNGVLEQ